MSIETSLPLNIHEGFAMPHDVDPTSLRLLQGDYYYYHYCCDSTNDVGWGCGYRTLQTICSWIRQHLLKSGKDPHEVPSIPEIQSALVKMGDKPCSFQNSKQWIGSVEVAMITDYFYDVSCKILHINKGKDLIKHIKSLREHFEEYGSPIMMGGESDTSSKGILGICDGNSTTYLLILDPHFKENNPTQQKLAEGSFLSWYPLDKFHRDTFYNLCLPLFKK